MRPLEVQRAVWVVTPLRFGPAVVYTQADTGAPASTELIAQARAAVGVGDSTGPRTVAARAPVATLYDCLTKCADSVVPPQFVLFPYQVVLDGVVLPARRAHVFVALQAVVDQDGLVEPETVRLLSSTAVGVVAQIERALPQARFRPGFANGVAVRTRVQLRFDFEAEGT